MQVIIVTASDPPAEERREREKEDAVHRAVVQTRAELEESLSRGCHGSPL